MAYFLPDYAIIMNFAAYFTTAIIHPIIKTSKDMRTRNLFIALTMMTATAAITACSNDENLETVDLNKPIDVNLSIGQPGTRATASSGDSRFETGDKISLTVVTKTGTGTTTTAIDATDATYRNTQTYTRPDTQSDVPWDGTFYWQNTSDTHSFYAYYPAQTDFPKKADDGSYTYSHDFTLPTNTDGSQIDNSTKDKLNQANFMYGKKDFKATNSTINLELSHCMSQITFTVEKGAGYADSEAMPTITKAEILNASGLYTAGTFNLGTTSAGTVTASTSVNTTTTAITPYRASSTATTWYAIVFPGQTFADKSNFIRFTTADNTTYTYNLGSTLTCAANYSYNYTLKLNRKDVTLGGFSVAAWTKTDATGNAGMDFPTN